MDKLPEGWKVIEIGQVAKVGNGSTPSRKESRFWENGLYPWLPTGKVNDRIIMEADEFISQSALDDWPMKLYPAGSVLMAMIGQGKTRGKVAYLAIDATINQNFACIVPGLDVSGRFLFFYLENSYRQLRDISHGSNQGALNCGLIEQFTIKLPPPAEQQRIAEILGAWDDAIALTGRLIDALKRRKQGLMQQLLTGQVRFPEFEGQAWRDTTLEEFFYEISERNDANEDLTVLSCSKVYGIVPQTEIFDKRVASADIQRYKVVEFGDLVFDSNLLWDASLGFLEKVDRGVVSPVYTTLRFKGNDMAVRDYFKHLLKTHFYRQHYKFISQGTNVRRRNAPTEAFLDLPVNIGSISEQEKILDVMANCDAEMSFYEMYLEDLAAQKSGLMQRLLTGQIRVQT